MSLSTAHEAGLKGGRGCVPGLAAVSSPARARRLGVPPVPIIRGFDHPTGLLADFKVHYNRYRGHMTLGGATPDIVHRGDHWQRPALSAKRLWGSIQCRLFPDARTTAYRLAVSSQAAFTAP